jgi:hypothetical protein
MADATWKSVPLGFARGSRRTSSSLELMATSLNASLRRSARRFDLDGVATGEVRRKGVNPGTQSLMFLLVPEGFPRAEL